jgi:hypothetical protein
MSDLELNEPMEGPAHVLGLIVTRSPQRAASLCSGHTSAPAMGHSQAACDTPGTTDSGDLPMGTLHRSVSTAAW